MNLLLCNDDGIFSAGIHALASELKPHHTITIVAPEAQRSGTGHAITCVEPVRVRKVTLAGLEGIDAYALTGTPADCARIGCTSLGLDIDMVISGINHGANLGSDVLYSGTVGAAMEGVLNGVPAIAISCYNHRAADFSAAARSALWAVSHTMENPLPRGMLLNINAPELPISEIKGVKLARLCLQTYGGAHSCFEDPYGMKHLWMPLEDKVTAFPQDENNDYDEYWVRRGYVTITPIHYDITCYAYMQEMDVSSFSLRPMED